MGGVWSKFDGLLHRVLPVSWYGWILNRQAKVAKVAKANTQIQYNYEDDEDGEVSDEITAGLNAGKM